MRKQAAAYFVSVVALVLPAASPPIALAQTRAAEPGRHGFQQQLNRQLRGQWWTDEQAATELGLTAEQLERLDEMGQRYVEQGRAFRKEYMQSYRALIVVLNDYDSSDQVIAERRQAFEKIRAELVAMTVDELLEVRSILNPEQWAKLPKVAPQALRLGQATYRGGGVASAGSGQGAPKQ